MYLVDDTHRGKIRKSIIENSTDGEITIFPANHFGDIYIIGEQHEEAAKYYKEKILDDIQAILNMRDAWKHLLTTINEPVTFEYWCKLNEFIARNEALEWGKLRTGTVGISGTDYMPPIPQQESVQQELSDILNADVSATEKALNAFVWGARGQFFWDGNKRTSLTLANKILVEAGAGILTITDKHMEQFNVLLLDYYNTGISDTLKVFLYENAIQGINV